MGVALRYGRLIMNHFCNVQSIIYRVLLQTSQGLGSIQQAVMEPILQDLIDSLKSASRRFAEEEQSLQAALHDTEKLPDQMISSLASNALDLVSEIRLSLEPGHVLLADQILGTVSCPAS